MPLLFRSEGNRTRYLKTCDQKKGENGNIRNIQITGNDVEYNYGAGGSDIWFIANKIGIREGAITGNTIQAVAESGGSNIRIEGFRPNSPLKADYSPSLGITFPIKT